MQMTLHFLFTGKKLHEIKSALSSGMAKAEAWLDRNMLTLNVKKTKCMLIGTSKKLSTYNEQAKDLAITIGGEIVEMVTKFKYL